MDLAKFSSKFWKKPDSKILFANFAGQRRMEIIPDNIADAFKDQLTFCGEVEPSAEEILADRSLAGSSFSLADAHFCSSISPTLAGKQIVFRVAPLALILSKIDMNGKETRLQRQLEIFMDVTKDDLTRKQAEIRLRSAFGKGEFSEFEFDWPHAVEAFTAFALEAQLKQESGSGLVETRSKQPRFITYLIDDAEIENERLVELKNDLATTRGYGAADFARDLFGLDHLADHYGGKPNVLGFVAFQASELNVHKCTRPTIFDDTSALRFRGVCSKDGPPATQWGHTADLYKLYHNSAGGSIVGCPEAVIDNPSLLNDRKVLVGYLGPLGVLREDHNDLEPSIKPTQYAKMQELHDAFLKKCMTEMSLRDVHAAVS